MQAKACGVKKNVKTLLQRERDHQLNLNLLMTSFRIFLPTMQLDNGIFVTLSTTYIRADISILILTSEEDQRTKF